MGDGGNSGSKDSDVDLRLSGKVVSRCCVDNAFILEILEKEAMTSIRIGGLMDMELAGDRLTLSGERPAEAGRACILMGKTIEHAVGRSDGSLEIAFTDGSRLDVPVDPHYEAWEASADDGFMVVSLPGGRLAVWSGRRNGSERPRDVVG